MNNACCKIPDPLSALESLDGLQLSSDAANISFTSWWISSDDQASALFYFFTPTLVALSRVLDVQSSVFLIKWLVEFKISVNLNVFMQNAYFLLLLIIC